MPVVHPAGWRAPRRVGVVVVSILLGTMMSLLSTSPAIADSQPTAAELRAQADALSNRYFDALANFQGTQLEIAHDEQLVAQLSAQAQKARSDARARALLAYESSGSKLQAFVDGGDALDAARRARLIDH